VFFSFLLILLFSLLLLLVFVEIVSKLEIGGVSVKVGLKNLSSAFLLGVDNC
jgi:hypothetical protein